MNRMVKPLIGMVMVPIVGWAMWVAASEPLFVRPYGQPALVNHAASGVGGPSGFDQAQGRGR